MCSTNRSQNTHGGFDAVFLSTMYLQLLWGYSCQWRRDLMSFKIPADISSYGEETHSSSVLQLSLKHTHTHTFIVLCYMKGVKKKEGFLDGSWNQIKWYGLLANKCVFVRRRQKPIKRDRRMFSTLQTTSSLPPLFINSSYFFVQQARLSFFLSIRLKTGICFRDCLQLSVCLCVYICLSFFPFSAEWGSPWKGRKHIRIIKDVSFPPVWKAVINPAEAINIKRWAGSLMFKARAEGGRSRGWWRTSWGDVLVLVRV